MGARITLYGPIHGEHSLFLRARGQYLSTQHPIGNVRATALPS